MNLDGLNYPIKIKNEFTATLNELVNGVTRAKESLKGFQREVANVNTLSKTLKQYGQDFARVSAGLADAQRKLQAVQRQATATSRQQKAAANQLRKSRNQEVRAAKQLQLAKKQQAQAERSLGNAQSRNAGAVQRSTRATRTFTRATKQAAAASSDLGFRIRRVVEAVGTLIILRRATQTFQAFTRSAIEFNSEFETGKLGIASVLTAVGDVIDSQGRAVSGVEALAAAQGEAARQAALLRTEGLKTSATFEQLVDVFQRGVGPGLAAGLDLNQIRQLSVRISQAATAIGVRQDQLDEEIRSILTGNITRNSRIARVLNIDPADIRNAREAGVLFDVLQDKLDSFATSGAASLKLLNVQLVNLRDASRQAIGEGSQGFTDALSRVVQRLQGFVAGENADGLFRINPQSVQLTREIGSALEFAVDQGEKLIDNLSFDQVSQTFTTLGSAIRLGATALAQFAEFGIRTINVIGQLANGLGLLLQPVFAIGRELGFIVRELGPFVVGVTLLSRAFGVLAVRIRTYAIAARAAGFIGSGAGLGILGFARSLPVIGLAVTAFSALYTLFAERGVSATEAVTEAQKQYNAALLTGTAQTRARDLEREIKAQERIAEIAASTARSRGPQSPFFTGTPAAIRQFELLSREAEAAKNRLTELIAERNALFAGENTDTDGIGIQVASDGVEKAQNLLRKYNQELVELQREQRLSANLVNLTGDALREQQVLNQAELKTRKDLLEIDNELARVNQKRLALQTSIEARREQGLSTAQLDASQRALSVEEDAILKRRAEIVEAGRRNAEQRNKTQRDLLRPLREQELIQARLAATQERLSREQEFAETTPQVQRTLALRQEELSILAQIQKTEFEASRSGGIQQQILEERIALLREQLEIKRQELEFDRQTREEPLLEGLKTGAQDFAREFSDTFTLTRELAFTSLQQLGSTLGNVFVAAFGPESRNRIRSLFAQLLASLGQQLAESAFLRLISSVLGGGRTGEIAFPGANENIPGFAEGGYIGSNAPRAAPLAGLHPSDVVPARLAIGEYVMDASTVRAWGAGFFRWLQSNAPSGSGGLLGRLMGSSSPRPQRKRGYATGGLVGALQGQNVRGQGARLNINVAAAIAPSEETAFNLLQGASGDYLNSRFGGELRLEEGGGI